MKNHKFWHFGGSFGPLLHAKFHPIGATYRRYSVKNLKIALLSNLNTSALCTTSTLAAQNAASNKCSY